MATSSSLPRTWKYNVFTSFHGPDVRKTFLSHLRKQFNGNGITMFDDTGIERGDIIAPALKQGIRDSRISIVVLSKKYASSSWCLDELLDILKCKEDAGQIVMTVFYGVDPSHVRKQIGDFGDAFNETCALKTEEEKRKWSQALTYVGNIAGEDFKNWKNEVEMIEKIARDVSDRLNFTPSRDFDDGMVGLEAHFRKVESLLDLDNDGVKIIGISGPAGIGKSTIARALRRRLSNRFPLTCFLDELWESNLVKHSSKWRLQEQLLSKILNLDIKVDDLNVMKNKLHCQKVLIILDDVEHQEQLETLAKTDYFGPGSRVVVTTENKEILQQHGINDNDIYHVCFPSSSEALMIFCLYAFRQSSPPYGFRELANKVSSICGKLPLALQVLGSLMRGKSQADWIDELPRLKNSLDGRIESVLKVGYERLHEKDQSLFLFIAVFFNYKHVDHVTSTLAKINLDVRLGLKNLANRCLIHYEDSRVVMHHLLQLMARQVISKQESWKRQILVDAQQIFYVLENAEGNGSILGISFDVAESNELKINSRAFEKMPNLRFLEVWHTGKTQLHISEEMEFLPRLMLLRWGAYPGKSLPRRFCPENLVEFDMPNSQLEKLWEGTQPLANLKKMNLRDSYRLRELPDFSNSTNLEKLDLNHCTALVELPSSFSNLHKLVQLQFWFCESLEAIPSLINLVSLQWISMLECGRLRNFPNIGITNHKLTCIDVRGSINLKTFLTDLPTSVEELSLNGSDIERITDCIKNLHNLEIFELSDCKRLVSLPELPSSLECLAADNCESLERVSGPLNTPNARLDFSNCFKLDGEARRTIIQRSFVNGFALLPGKEVPAEFNHRARGDFITIPHSAFYKRFKVCLVISPYYIHEDTYQDGDSEDNEFKVPKRLRHCIVINVPHIEAPEGLKSEHLLIFQSSLAFINPFEWRRKIVLKFKTYQVFDIRECGIQIYGDETHGYNNGGPGNEDGVSDLSYTHESEDEEGYESESEEMFDDKDEVIGDDGNYESVSRKRPRETTSDEPMKHQTKQIMTLRRQIKNVTRGIQRLRLS